MKSCGLDASTSVIGVSVLDDDKIELLTHIDLSKCKSFWEKCDFAQINLARILTEHQPDVVVIEEALKKFTPGMSSADTISLLLRWNGIVSYFSYKLMNFPPTYVGANEARRAIGIPLLSKKKSGKPHKEQAFDWCVAGPLSHLEFPRTKTGKFKPFVADIVDSYVLARAGLCDLNKVDK